MVIGEVLWSLLAKLILCDGGSQAKEACMSVKLFKGLVSGVEGGIQKVRERAELVRGKTGKERWMQMWQLEKGKD